MEVVILDPKAQDTCDTIISLKSEIVNGYDIDRKHHFVIPLKSEGGMHSRIKRFACRTQMKKM